MWILGLVLAGILLLVLIEWLSFLFLRLLAPGRARAVSERHAIFGRRRWSPEEQAMPNESVDHRGLRKRRDPTPSYPLMGWRYPKPSIYWDLQTDQDGFIPNRRGDRSAVDREAAVRIWLVGGSTMAGSGASANNRTIAAFLEEILEATMEHSTSVVNAGVGGWSSQNELGFLTQELFPFHRPDAVVVMNGYNDTWRAVVAGAKFRRHENGGWISDSNYLYDPRLEAEIERAARGLQPASTANQGWTASAGSRFLARRNYYLGEFLSGAPTNASAPAAEFGEIDESRIVRPPLNVVPYLANVRTSVLAAKGWGVPVLYVLQPSIVYKAKLTPEELGPLDEVRRRTYFEGRWRAYRAGRGCCFDDIQRRFFEQARPEFLKLAAELNSDVVRFVDLSRYFADHTEDLFYDYCHYTDRGNELLAQAFARELRRLAVPGLKPPQSLERQ